jgi:thiol-disulfide isomerase/thioredoxin
VRALDSNLPHHLRQALTPRAPVHRWALVAFVAPWCAHCKALRAPFERVAEGFDQQIVVAGVDAAESELLDRFDIDSFPQLLWFDGSSTYPYRASEARPERYSGPRTFDAMTAFLEERSGVRSRERSQSDDEAAADGASGPCGERGPLPSDGRPAMDTQTIEKVLNHAVALQRRRQDRQAEQLASGLKHSGLAVDLARNNWQSADGRVGTVEPFSCEALSKDDAARAAAGDWEHARHAPAPPPAEPSPPPLVLPPHKCEAVSQAYVECMRHRADRQHICDNARHEYLLCMSGRWAVHPDHHRAMAEEYGRHYVSPGGRHYIAPRDA